MDAVKQSEDYQRRITGVSVSKKKYAVCFGYLGSAYQGLQINPDAKSVEAELERALFLVGAIDECNFGYMQKIGWSRAARTGEVSLFRCAQ
jgi:tRNA pseudouridine38-40 synthase